MTDDNVGSLWSRWSRGCQRVRQASHWSAFAGQDWLDRIMTVEVTDRLFKKQGRSIARWTLTNDGRELIVFLKRHFVLKCRHGLLAVLFPHRAWSPGLQEWEHLEWANGVGIPVPRAVAAAELLQPHGRLTSLIAIEELANQLPLHEAVPLAQQRLGATDFRRWKRTLSDELVRLSHEFHGRHRYHKDWYFCHFYIDEGDTRCVPAQWMERVTVIDLHRLTRHRFFGPWRRAKDLAQLLYSSDVAGITDRDRLEFWAKYRRQSSLSSLTRRIALAKWRLYKRHDAPKG